MRTDTFIKCIWKDVEETRNSGCLGVRDTPYGLHYCII